MDYQLYLGDCLEIMQQFEKQSVDLILADLPYGQTQNDWDKMIPLDLMWAQYKRVIKRNRAIVLTAIQPFSSMLVMSNLDQFRDEWTWDKVMPTNFLNVKKSPMRRHENILVFCETLPLYNPQLNEDIKMPSGKMTSGNSDNWGEFKKEGIKYKVGYPQSIIRFAKPNRLTDWDYGLHPNQKPVALLEYLIKTYSNEGDLVLDNTMGSGSTGEAALKTQRRFTGIEKDESYFQIAKQRLESLVELPEGKIVKVKNKEQDISLDLW